MLKLPPGNNLVQLREPRVYKVAIGAKSIPRNLRAKLLREFVFTAWIDVAEARKKRWAEREE